MELLPVLDTTVPLQKPGFKPRRAHKKSRLGCLGCKQRRKKCDELKPRCSRCADRNLPCQYPTKASESQSRWGQHLEPPSQMDQFWNELQDMSLLSPISTSCDGSTRCSPPNVSPTSSPLPWLTSSDYGESSALERTGDNSLNSTEMELLSHYLTHTARYIAYDDDDLYALKVGFPNLAFRNKTLMSSILALAAVCKCQDIITRSGKSEQGYDESQIRKLLALAEKHHISSLEHTQAEIPSADDYDSVLANAPLMVLYGTASHSVRIQLAQINGLDREAASLACPPSQWISLIRAAHLAYTGLLKTDDAPDSLGPETFVYSPASPTFSGSENAFLGEDGPTEATKQFFLPIVASTSADALTKLRNKAEAIRMLCASTPDLESAASTKLMGSLGACSASIGVLDNVLAETFSTSFAQPLSEELTKGLGHFGQRVSPWLREYLARVTSATPIRPLRRTIMSFLNRVPAEFLALVQDIADSGPAKGDELWNTVSSKSSPVDGLVMDVLAHWLVLVMLLDGVWWIGDIGGWELQRVVSLMKQQDPFTLGCDDEKWWPESMYNIREEVRKHIVRK